MTAGLMIYGTVVGTLVAAFAMGAQSVARRTTLPARLVWTSAIVLTLSLIGIAAFRGNVPSEAVATATQPTATGNASAPSALSWTALPRRFAESERKLIVAPLERVIVAIESRIPQSADKYLIALWLTMTVGLSLLMIVVQLRLARDRRAWPVATLRAVRVRVAPSVGPAVIGVIHPDIVVPQWILGRTGEEQRLVLEHETEHMRAMDPLLLVLGCAAVAAVPWNPAAWWMLSRLRLAVELDCDARVLRGGVAPGKYGDLLIDLAGQCSGFRMSVAALADDSSHLQQRLNAMKPEFSRFARARGVVFGALALSCLVVACDTSMPTSAEVSKMDAASAERAAKSAYLFTPGATPTVFTVNDVVVTEAEAKAIPADRIASIKVAKGINGEAELHLLTKTGDDVAVSPAATTAPKSEFKFSGLVIIDGVRTDQAAFKKLDPKSIATVEVVKGPAATGKYNDPLAANGVIVVTTKKQN